MYLQRSTREFQFLGNAKGRHKKARGEGEVKCYRGELRQLHMELERILLKSGPS